jgi:hypothetical protein
MSLEKAALAKMTRFIYLKTPGSAQNAPVVLHRFQKVFHLTPNGEISSEQYSI